tara:strand:- start:1006 stop:1239 length:234 start_codon:yes stop_codon:yes gene_type:complete
LNIKDKAALARNLSQDETFMEILHVIRGRQTNVFLDSQSPIETIKQAHDIIRALNLIENQFHTVFADEAIYDKKHKD